jgi:hypothetical protein
VRDDHLADPDPAVEVNLVVGLVALGADLEDELGAFDAPAKRKNSVANRW